MRVEIISKAQAICDTPIHYGDFVSVHYNGTLEDGTWFDSTSLKNEPFVFQIGAKKVIPGWEQGLINKCKGDRILLTVPPHLGYGHRAVGSIPEDSTLIFSIEVVEVIPFLQAQQQFQQNPDEFDY
ncbi:peptidylprolyl isomerase [Entamoeba marina]